MCCRNVLTASLAAAALAFASSAGAISASAAQKPNFVFEAPVRTVIDNGAPGVSVGDLTVSSGLVQDPLTGKRNGYYATNQITVRADASTGREIRKVDLSIKMGKDAIFATSLIRATAGAPPTKRMTFAITGGLGAYVGATGTLEHEAVANKPTFDVTLHLEP